jgi:uncharacterized protein (TIGR03435 family)
VLLPVALLTAGLFCQSFEVASVKPSKSTTGRVTIANDPGRISYSNIMLRRVLLTAYDIKPYQLVGPEWLDTLRFDIEAKFPESATNEQIQAMLRDLLATRFKMAVHRESKELPIYALLVGKTGPKIKPKAEGASTGEEQVASMQKDEGKDGFPVLALPASGLVIETRNGRARITAKDVPIEKLADLLSGQVGRPVLDKTGLGGDYSFVLYFTPEGAAAGDEPFLFTALQEQLGLKLEARKGPVDLLVIDHAEKVPTEN